MSVLTIALLTAGAAIAQSGSVGQTPTPQPIAEGFGKGAYLPQPGITDPVPVKKVEPQYTSEAMRVRIQGAVELEAIVEADGTIGAIRVVQSLDVVNGLDDEAVKAARQWRFQPGLESGRPVPVLVRLLLEYRMHGGPDAEPPRIWVADGPFLNGVARLGQANVTMPIVERAVEPKYTPAAMSAKITGTVTVDMVVGPDGRVARSRIARPIEQADGTKASASEVRRWFGSGLNLAAMEAARQWRFKPGLVNGEPANVLVTVTMEFRIH